MDIRRGHAAWTQVEADWLVIPVAEPVEIAGQLGQLDQALGGVVARLKEAGDLTGKLAATVALRGVSGIAASRVLFVGLGKADELSAGRLDKALVTAARAIADKKETRVVFAVPDAPVGVLAQTDFAAAAAAAVQIGSLGQDLFRTERNRFPFASATIASPTGKPAELDAAIARGRII